MKKHKILITVEGGVIQDISNIPENTEVEVYDYDCDEYPNDNNNVEVDEDGDEYWKSVWDR